MSNSSGRPTVRINEKSGKPPSYLTRRQERAANPNQEKVVKPKPHKVASNKPAKPDWRLALPVWLQRSEPKSKNSGLWVKWYLYSRMVFALPAVKKNPETASVPNFIDFQKVTLQNNDYVRNTRSDSSAVICMPAASGGVGKTTISTLLGAQRRISTDLGVIVYDGDTSDPNVFMWYDLNQDEDWLTGESLLARLNLGWVPTYNELTHSAAIEYDSGVMAIHAKRGAPIDAESTRLILDRLQPCCHSLICDTQPGTAEDEQTHMIVQTADIVVVPGIASSAKELQSVSATLDYVPFGLRDSEGKVAPHVIIAISNVKRKEFNLRTRYLFAQRYNATLDQIVLLPYSQYIKGNGNFDKINKIKIDALDARMRYAASDLDRAVTELAIQLNKERRPIESSWNEVPAEPLFVAPSYDQSEHFESAHTS